MGYIKDTPEQQGQTWYRAYIINNRYARVFESPWFSSETAAESALAAQYKRMGTNPDNPNVFGSGIDENERW